MIGAFLKLFVGHPYKKFLNRARPLIGRINALEAEYQQLTDAELQGKTQEFKERFNYQKLLQSSKMPHAASAGGL